VAAQSGGGDNGGQTANLGLVYGIGITVVLLLILFRAFHDPLIYFLFNIKYYELRFISLFAPYYEGLIAWIESTNMRVVTLDDLRNLSYDVGLMLRVPFIAIGLIFSVIIYYFHPDNLYRAVENMDSLREKMEHKFPSTRAVLGLDLVNEPIDEGPWAMALTPVEFAKKNKLLYRDADTNAITLDKQRARVAFSNQLGPLWVSVENLSKHERALFGIFAAFANYQRDLANKMLDQISASVTQDSLKTGNLNFSGIDDLVDRFGNSVAVQRVLERHAYTSTVFMALLKSGRSTGIVANSLFQWLKPTDRQLWYTLCNVGRKAVFAETAAVQAHFLAEMKLGSPIEQPMVDEAVSALEAAIKIRIIRDVH
jgi:intracellular multiplication protein IcmP